MIRLQFMLSKYFNNLCDYVTMSAAFFSTVKDVTVSFSNIPTGAWYVFTERVLAAKRFRGFKCPSFSPF